MNAAVPSWYDVVDGTWPAAAYSRHGLWTVREGLGGGSRVSSTSLVDTDAQITPEDIAEAEAAMRDLGQPLLFMVRKGENDLDRQLEDRGYQVKDPVTIYACPVGQLTDVPVPPVTVLLVWEPLAIMREIWASGGIGGTRLSVMHRATGPKVGFLGRHRDKPAGVAFAAIHQGVAMVHAVEILAHQRRAGMGRWIMRAAAFWAAQNGADTISVVCTEQNAGANALYASLGMQTVGQYHYRHLPNGA